MRADGGLRRLFGLVIFAAALIAAAPAHAAMVLTPAYTDSPTKPVSQPMFVTAPPQDSSRLFVVTRPGVIRVAVGGVMQATPFLDISARVGQAGEGGLLSMAFDPDYSTSGLFYVYFVSKAGSSNGDIHIEEFHRSADPNVADPTGRLVLAIPPTDAQNHYGGTIGFGPDDLLYAAPGDGGGSDNQYGNAQNPTKSLLGKLLRIDPHESGTDPNKVPYTIPADNPYAGQPRCNPPGGTTNCPEILALGLRNPFRWSFDRTGGDLVIGDVGQGVWEEVDYVPAGGSLSGANFGWPCFEGPDAHVACTAPSYLPPVFSYRHSGGSVAITGGVVVRDPALTPLFGRYLYADFYAGRIRSLKLGTPTASDDRLEDLPKVPQLVAFGQDADARTYVVSLAGSVYRIVCDGSCEATDPGSGGGSAQSPVDSPPGQQPPADQAGPPPAAPQPVTRDAAPPLLRIRAARIQDVVGRGTVRLSAASNEDCFVRASARARGLALRGRIARLAGGKRIVVTLNASQRLRRALARRGSVAILVRARDSAGNLRQTSLTVRVKRS